MIGDYKNALFINFGGIGDEILFLPTLTSFKKQYPDSRITLALEERAKSIKDLTCIINETISVNIKDCGFKKYLNILNFIFKVRNKKFDCVISSGKSPFIATILFLTGIKERIGYKSKTDFLLTKKITLNENQYAGKMYHSLVEDISDTEYDNPKIDIPDIFQLNNGLIKGEYIIIHPGVSKMSVNKNILKCPNLDFWTNLITGLIEKNKKVVLLGSEDDRELIERILENKNIKNNEYFINYFKKTKNIMEMAYLMKNSNCVICVDSAPLHVAVAVGAKVFAIFCPTNEKKLVPESENVTIIKNEKINCRPCLWHKNKHNCKTSECLNINYKNILHKIN